MSHPAHSEVSFVVADRIWLSANDRRHWADKAKRTKALRESGVEFGGMLLRLGGRSLGTTHVAAFIGYPRAGRADPANAAPTVKALIDGMVDAGVWPDDDSVHIVGPTFLRDPVKAERGTHTVRLVLTPQDIPWLPTTTTHDPGSLESGSSLSEDQ